MAGESAEEHGWEPAAWRSLVLLHGASLVMMWTTRPTVIAGTDPTAVTTTQPGTNSPVLIRCDTAFPATDAAMAPTDTDAAVRDRDLRYSVRAAAARASMDRGSSGDVHTGQPACIARSRRKTKLASTAAVADTAMRTRRHQMITRRYCTSNTSDTSIERVEMKSK
jgi:hypothetical protein